jgi:SAM-dependent methyltransferase
VTEARPDPDPALFADPRPAYDTTAESYAATFLHELSHKPFDRDLLDRFATAVAPAAHQAMVCDLGCGPGHIGAYLAEKGLPVMGVDLSTAMVEVAKKSFPTMTFALADMTALDQPAAAFAAITCFYAIIHLPRARVPIALSEMHRTLVGDGALLLSAHGGQGSLHADEMRGHPVSLDATLFELDELSDLIESAGFAVVEAHERAPYEDELATPRLYVWATRQP